MKTKLITAAAALLLAAAKLTAADLCVEENGNGGCYSTITAAVAAATNGDRIIITPKAGNAAYVENISINKTLQFLCAIEGGQYVVQGTWTVVPAIGRTITIIGMKNLSGDLTTAAASPAGARCKVSFLGGEMTAGNINFPYDNYEVIVGSSTINGYINFRYGRVFGNVINTAGFYYCCNMYSAITVTGEATPGTDSVWVVGNKITNNASYYTSTGIFFASTSQYLYCVNNLMTLTATASWGVDGVYFYSSHAMGTGRNTIMNNTIQRTGPSAIMYGVDCSGVTSYTDIVNNIFIGPNGNGVYGGGSITGISYNLMPTPMTLGGSAVDDGTNNFSSNTTLDANGRPVTGSDAINGASPDFSYYDLDLSAGDAGAYGGSLSLDNFFPVTGGARVYMMYVPRRVNVSGTINIKADSFDR